MSKVTKEFIIEQNHVLGKTLAEISREFNIGYNKLSYCVKQNSITLSKIKRVAHNAIDRTGERHGKLIIMKRVGVNKYKQVYWECQCDCGNIKTFPYNSLIKCVDSCGCLNNKPACEYSVFTGYKELTGTHFASIKNGAENRGIRFEVSKEYLYNLFIIQNRKCAITGIDLTLHKKNSTKYKKFKTASLDRIDSSKGYIEGNVQWLHVTVNKMKWDLSQEDFIKVCNVVAKRNPTDDLDSIPDRLYNYLIRKPNEPVKA